MAHHSGNDEKLQFQDRNRREKSVADYDCEGFENRLHKSQADSYDDYGREPKNVSYTHTQGLSRENDPVEEERGYGSGEKRPSQHIGTEGGIPQSVAKWETHDTGTAAVQEEDGYGSGEERPYEYLGTEGGIPQSFAKWETKDIGSAAVEEEGGHGSGEKRSSQYLGTEGGIPQSFGKLENQDIERAAVEEEGGYGSGEKRSSQYVGAGGGIPNSFGKWENENTGRAAVVGEAGGYGTDEKRSSYDVGCGDGVPHSIGKVDSEYRKHSTDDIPYISAERPSSYSDFGSKTSSDFAELRKPGGGNANEDISYELKKADDGMAGYVQSAEEPYAKEERGGSSNVMAAAEPRGREEGGGSEYIQAAEKEKGGREQEEEGYREVDETSTYQNSTQEDSKEGLKEKLQEKLFPGHKKGGEEYEVDGSHEKRGFVNKIEEKLKGKPQGDAESKYEEEEDKGHEDINYESNKADDGVAGYAQSAEEPYAKEERGGSGYVKAAVEPCGGEEGGDSEYIPAAAKEKGARKQVEEGYYGVNEASPYQSSTQEESTEGLEKKLQETLFPGNKKGGEEYEVDGSHEKRGFVEKIEETLKSKPQGDAESKYEEEKDKGHEDINYELNTADDGVAGYAQSVEEPYAKDERGGSGYVKAAAEPCGREEGGESEYIPAAEKKDGARKQVEEGYYGVNEASTYQSSTQEDSKEGLKEKLQEKFSPGHKTGGEDYEVDGSREKKGFVEKIKETLKGKPQGDAESKYEEEDKGHEDISYELAKADDGVAGNVQSAEEPYAKDERGETGYVNAAVEPCGREEGGKSKYIPAAAKEEGARKQEEEGSYGVNEASTFKSSTQEDSKEGLKEKLQENLFPVHKKGGEDYEVDGSHEKKGFVEKIEEKLKDKPQGDSESKHEEEEDKGHDQEHHEYPEGKEKEGHKKGIFEKIMEKLSPSP